MAVVNELQSHGSRTNFEASRLALRERLRSDRILILPGAADAMTARVIEQTGFEGIYVTGAGFANASFGRPDVGLITLPEVREHLRRIAGAVSIPLIVDADTGYGGVLNVGRTVNEFEAAGAAAIQIEDQAEPKRCGHFDGNSVVSVGEMVQRLSAAVDARVDPNLMIIARTDAYQGEGLEGAIERARAYVDAGADALFIEAPTNLSDLEALPSLVDAPLIANMVEGGKTPMVAAKQLEEMGFKVALFANTALRTAMHAVRDAMRVLHAEGDTTSLLNRMLTWDERQELIGLPELQAREARLLATDQPHVGLDDSSTRPPATT